MQRTRPRAPWRLALALGLSALLSACRCSAPQDGVWRGVSLGLFASDPAYDYDPFIAEIAARGATDLLIVVPWHQAHKTASALLPRQPGSPTEATVARTLAQARARGLRLGVMPIVRLLDRTGGAWRGQIEPADRAAWFAAYEARLGALAGLAEAAGAAWLVVGSELTALQADPRWPALIARLRPTPLALAWSANWDAFDPFPHWRHLDLVGLTAYFPLDPNDLPGSWAPPLAQIRALRARTGKPVILTEVGWPARATAAARPWDDAGAAEPEPQLQAALWRGFCAAFAPAGAVDGFFAWNWFGYGGPRDAGYSLRGKPAAAALGACFARPWRSLSWPSR